MDVDNERAGEKYLKIYEILNNLLSCSLEESPLEKTLHVYDPRELQSGWQCVSSNVKYFACPEKRERPTPSVISDPSSSCSAIKQKRHTSKEKSKDFKTGNVYQKFNKFESLGVLSYGVPSWRTIVDPETHTYLNRSHPCYFDDARPRTSERNAGITFSDPGTALDQHLGSFIKRQRTNKAVQSNLYDNIGSTNGADQHLASSDIHLAAQPHKQSQSVGLIPNEDIVPLISRNNVLRLSDIPAARIPSPNSVTGPTPIKHPKAYIHNSCIPLTRRLSPLTTGNRAFGSEKRHLIKRPRELAHCQQLRQMSPVNNPNKPVSCQLVKPINKQLRQQKLNWLPITSTSACIPGNVPVEHSEYSEQVWPKTIGLMSNNPINQAIKHLKSQIPAKEKERTAHTLHMGYNIPCKVVELPLGFGSN